MPPSRRSMQLWCAASYASRSSGLSRKFTSPRIARIVRDGTSSAGDDDYELDPMTVTIEAGAMSGHTLVEAIEDGTAE